MININGDQTIIKGIMMMLCSLKSHFKIQIFSILKTINPSVATKSHRYKKTQMIRLIRKVFSRRLLNFIGNFCHNSKQLGFNYLKKFLNIFVGESLVKADDTEDCVLRLPLLPLCNDPFLSSTFSTLNVGEGGEIGSVVEFFLALAMA